MDLVAAIAGHDDDRASRAGCGPGSPAARASSGRPSGHPRRTGRLARCGRGGAGTAGRVRRGAPAGRVGSGCPRRFDPPFEPRHESAEIRAAAAEEFVELVRRELLWEVAEGLDDRPEGQALASQLDAPAFEHANALPAGVVRQLVQEAGLADPRFAGNEENRRRSAARAIEGGRRVGELRPPTHERQARDAGGHGSFWIGVSSLRRGQESLSAPSVPVRGGPGNEAAVACVMRELPDVTEPPYGEPDSDAPASRSDRRAAIGSDR